MRYATIILLSLLTVGCRSFKNNGNDRSTPALMISDTDLGPTPVFSLNAPADTKLTVLHGKLAADKSVKVDASATVAVFVKDAGFWFQLGTLKSGGFWYSRSVDGAAVVYNGSLGHNEYCIYQYTPTETSADLY